jgi:adenylate cyclase
MLSLLALVAVLAFLYHLVSSASRETLIESSERVRGQISDVIAQRISNFLNQAPECVRQYQAELTRGLADPRDARSVEASLFALLLANRQLAEVTLTFGEDLGFDAAGEIKLGPGPRGQWSVMRTTTADGADHYWSRHVYQDGPDFVADRRDLGVATPFAQPARWIREKAGNVSDPTAHPTFVTPAGKNFRGQLLWSDLHWSQLDADLPKEQRRVEVSVQQAVTDAAGNFAGVLRVGLLTQQLDEKVRLPLALGGEIDPHRTFLCDEQGQLITRLLPSQRLEEVGDDLRIASGTLPPEISTALAGPILRRAVARRGSSASGEFATGGQDYFVTFHELPRAETQDWVIGIVVPRAFYLGKLAMMRQQLLSALLVVIALIVVGGWLILSGVRRAQAQVNREALKMNAFDFTPARPVSAFRDVEAVLESLERAKTAMRAMSKYVPVDLVRRLYQEESEPTLGGEPIEVSIMFTDIKDFTAISEKLPPNVLAEALGRYLDVMARILQQEAHGTIDKYIGDAIMTFWNAPEMVADHARMACLAALHCRDAGRALAESPEQGGLPPFETRFGLHCGTATVGHFGSRDRMNYTAIGDVVNLASRLEGQNKQYGTTIMASEAIVQAVGDAFEFRLLDLVAVKGKSEAIRIFELLGPKSDAGWMRETVAAYERAFGSYLQRDFAAAIEILEKQTSDPPSAHLLARCRAFLVDPPPADWDGIQVSLTK